MKLAWMHEDIASARRATTFLVMLLLGSMLVNLVLAVFAVRLAGHERVVVVPPTIHKTFWVESGRVSGEYLEQMGYFLMQLTLNVTPQSVDHQATVLLQYRHHQQIQRSPTKAGNSSSSKGFRPFVVRNAPR
jgi:conjugal transfer pilus assembly protein TraE